MTRNRRTPLTAQELNQLAGRRLSRSEREDWRNRADAEWGTLGTTGQKADPNVYQTHLAEFEPSSSNPKERAKEIRRYERMKEQAKIRTSEIQDEIELERVRGRMQEHPDIIQAQSHFADVLNDFPTDTPEDVRDKGRATELLQSAMDGDLPALKEYYATASRLCDRRLEQYDKGLNEARKAASEARSEEARREAADARMKAAKAKGDLNVSQLESLDQ